MLKLTPLHKIKFASCINLQQEIVEKFNTNDNQEHSTSSCSQINVKRIPLRRSTTNLTTITPSGICTLGQIYADRFSDSEITSDDDYGHHQDELQQRTRNFELKQNGFLSKMSCIGGQTNVDNELDTKNHIKEKKMFGTFFFGKKTK